MGTMTGLFRGCLKVSQVGPILCNVTDYLGRPAHNVARRPAASPHLADARRKKTKPPHSDIFANSRFGSIQVSASKSQKQQLGLDALLASFDPPAVTVTDNRRVDLGRCVGLCRCDRTPVTTDEADTARGGGVTPPGGRPDDVWAPGFGTDVPSN